MKISEFVWIDNRKRQLLANQRIFRMAKSSHSPQNDFGRLVWAPDEKDGFVLARVVDIATNQLTCDREDGKGQVREMSQPW